MIMEAAMRKQHILIYGLSLSPILAHFQNTPRKPSLFRSRMAGKIWCRYALVQMSRRIHSNKLGKLKRADIVGMRYRYRYRVSFAALRNEWAEVL